MRSELEYINTNASFGEDTKLIGNLRFNHSLRIMGSFEGSIYSEAGSLIIEDTSVVKADIKVKSITIAGIVHGNIDAEERIEMMDSGKVFGNIKTKKLKIADGVVFEGKCDMQISPDSIDIFSMPLEELKNSLITRN